VRFVQVDLCLFFGEGRLHFNLVFQVSQWLAVIRVDNQHLGEGEWCLTDIHELFSRSLILEHENIERLSILQTHWLQHLLEHRSEYPLINMDHQNRFLIFRRIR